MMENQQIAITEISVLADFRQLGESGFCQPENYHHHSEKNCAVLHRYLEGGFFMDHKQFYSISDVARFLDVQQHRIQYVHRSNKVPSPPLIAGRRLYRWADLQRLARHFNVPLKEELCS